ncbi:DMT family transporter [Kangiella sp. HZ709]|uniref:DMT family transporter n=1 Tax=Kangiella sp. HZ709 TaxID=2666328 RepID=UPI0012B016C2|nr:DMT family transporter [Kangiella sp. HZ709]MRX28149.1 EamA family transporter [Kangiella sp. HZ709]
MILQQKQSQLAAAGLLMAILLWSASFVAMKYAIAELGPMVTVFLRMLLAMAVLIFFLKPITKKQSYQKGDWWLLGLLALCEPCLYFIFESYALTYTTASEAGMVTALQPLLIAVAAFYFLKEKISGRTIVGCLLALAGVILLTVTGGASEHASNPWLGNLLEFGAIVAATVYCLLARKLAQRYSPIFLTMLQTIAGTVFFLPLVFMQTEAISFDISGQAILAILFLAFGVNIFAFTCYNFAFKVMPASQVGSLMNLLPLGTLFFGWLLLGETLAPMQYAAAGLVLIGVIWSQTKPKAKTVFIEQSAIARQWEAIPSSKEMIFDLKSQLKISH